MKRVGYCAQSYSAPVLFNPQFDLNFIKEEQSSTWSNADIYLLYSTHVRNLEKLPYSTTKIAENYAVPQFTSFGF